MEFDRETWEQIHASLNLGPLRNTVTQSPKAESTRRGEANGILPGVAVVKGQSGEA